MLEACNVPVISSYMMYGASPLPSGRVPDQVGFSRPSVLCPSLREPLQDYLRTRAIFRTVLIWSDFWEPQGPRCHDFAHESGFFWVTNSWMSSDSAKDLPNNTPQKYTVTLYDMKTWEPVDIEASFALQRPNHSTRRCFQNTSNICEGLRIYIHIHLMILCRYGNTHS